MKFQKSQKERNQIISFCTEKLIQAESLKKFIAQNGIKLARIVDEFNTQLEGEKNFLNPFLIDYQLQKQKLQEEMEKCDQLHSLNLKKLEETKERAQNRFIVDFQSKQEEHSALKIIFEKNLQLKISQTKDSQDYNLFETQLSEELTYQQFLHFQIEAASLEIIDELEQIISTLDNHYRIETNELLKQKDIQSLLFQSEFDSIISEVVQSQEKEKLELENRLCLIKQKNNLEKELELEKNPIFIYDSPYLDEDSIFEGVTFHSELEEQEISNFQNELLQAKKQLKLIREQKLQEVTNSCDKTPQDSSNFLALQHNIFSQIAELKIPDYEEFPSLQGNQVEVLAKDISDQKKEASK